MDKNEAARRSSVELCLKDSPRDPNEFCIYSPNHPGDCSWGRDGLFENVSKVGAITADSVDYRAPKPSTAITHYVDKAMFEAKPMAQGATHKPTVYVLSATPDPLGALAAFSKIYEGIPVYRLSEVSDEERVSYFDDVFNTTLQAPLEQIDFHFMVEGLTRASWDQMARQRTANFGGESLRFSVKLPLTGVVRPGPSIVGNKRREATHATALAAIESAYASLIADGVPAEDARGLIPMNVLVRGHWKTNLRNLVTELGKRSCTQAQWEWRMIIVSMREAVRKYPYGVQFVTDRGVAEVPMNAQWQFEYIADSPIWQPVCFSTGRCMFKAKADRGCTIRERVEAGRFDEIDVREWLLDPTAAWVR